jgi:excisionase family DNA binding protein
MLADHIAAMQQALTVEQMAALLQCSKKALYKMVRRGNLPSFQVGSMIRFDPEITAQWLRSRSVGKRT